MTGNNPDDDSDATPSTTEQRLPAEAAGQEQAVTLADVLAVQVGDAIAVRAVQESTAKILAGQVTSFADDSETKQAVEDRVEEYASVKVLSIDADTWWVLSEDDIVDRSDELHDRPPSQEYLDLPPKDPPACSLSYRETGRIGLRIPMPVWNGSRIIYYAADDYGPVETLTHGAIVQPKLLLPDTYSPP